MRRWVRGTFKSLVGLSRGISNRVSEKLMIVDLQAQSGRRREPGENGKGEWKEMEEREERKKI